MSHVERHTWPGGHPMWCPSCRQRVIPIGHRLCVRCEAAVFEDVERAIEEAREMED